MWGLLITSSHIQNASQVPTIFKPTMAEASQSGAAHINWDDMDKAMAEGRKLAASMASTLEWDKSDVSEPPEETRELTTQEVEDEWWRKFHEQHELSSDEDEDDLSSDEDEDAE